MICSIWFKSLGLSEIEVARLEVASNLILRLDLDSEFIHIHRAI